MSERVLKVTHGPYEYNYAEVNDHCTWRVKSLFSKEPDTVNWLEGMNAGEMLVDVGANIGLYTIFAAARGIDVVAFEPEAQNYGILCRNIFINNRPVLAYCCALSDGGSGDGVDLGVLYLSGYLPGGSCHSFNEEVDHRLQHRKSELRQGCIGIPLDRFNIKADYVKIDVDGFEHKVVEGGKNTIRNAKSVLIEINTALPEHMDLVDRMLEWGFKYDLDQVDRAQRKEGPFKGCGNYIFTR